MSGASRVDERAGTESAAQEVLQRVAGDLGLITERPIALCPVSIERACARPAGQGSIHISFKLGFRQDGRRSHGALLVPLPAALTVAGHLMLLSDTAVAAQRELETLDAAQKQALLELGNYVGGAADAALRGLGLAGVQACSEGCQGVRPGVRPALEYAEGEELVVARAELEIEGWPACEVLLILPVLESAVLRGAADPSAPA